MKKLSLLLLLFLAVTTTDLTAQTGEDFIKLNLIDEQFELIDQKKALLLTNKVTGNKKKIKEGGFALIHLKDDTTKRAVMIQAFLRDSVLVSYLKIDSTRKNVKFEFDEFKVIPLREVESIKYSVKNIKRTYWTGFTLIITGVDFAIIPLILGPASHGIESLSQPEIPAFVTSGVILFFIGKKLLKSLTPKDYNLSKDWSYKIVSK